MEKSRPKKMAAVADEFDEKATRRLIYNFHATENSWLL
jgi:hypothetical protein